MTPEQLNNFKLFVKNYTEYHTRTPEAARRCLVLEGLYDYNGTFFLDEEFHPEDQLTEIALDHGIN